MLYIMMKCYRCGGTGRLRMPSLVGTATKVSFNGGDGPETRTVPRGYPVKCRLCDGAGVFRVDLPELVASDYARAASVQE